MNFSWYTRVLLAVASGVVLALSFPNYNFSLLAWIAVGLLFLASYRAKLSVAPLYGVLNGLAFYPLSVPWMDVVIRQYGGAGPWASAGILGLVALVGGLITAAFSTGVALASRKGRVLACVLAPFLWVALEFARAHLPIIAFPWNLIGYAASGNLALVQLTTLTGIYGLSFVVAGYGAFLAYAILTGTQRVWKALLVTTAVLVLVAFSGEYFIPRATPHYMAHLVQTNFEEYYNYPPDWMQRHVQDLDQLHDISVDAARRKPGLIVWPEVPAPFTFQNPDFAARAEAIARDAGSDFLVGIVDWRRNADHQWQATNTATLIDPSGQRVFSYDKIHLVPFGEYVPLRRWLGFAGKLVADIGDFTPGHEYSVGELPGGKFGVYICYEGVFPGLVRRFTANGAQLLINISDDGWFGRSSASAQHAMMERLRAVENRRWLLRDTNNGYTIDVDPYGRVIAKLPPNVRGQLDAPYGFLSEMTPYAQFGNWFPWLCVMASAGLLGASILNGRNRQSGASTERPRVKIHA
ncbi:MAG: apolipoprotein N-acyltransferase [Candidatus Acidiferrales bacterium]